jgi:hypothetical protein
MGVFLTDEGRWRQAGAEIMFSPKDPKKAPYQATENSYHGNDFLAFASADADAGIVIPIEETKKDLDADPSHLPDHVLFKITAKVYDSEIKEKYPFHYIGKKP